MADENPYSTPFADSSAAEPVPAQDDALPPRSQAWLAGLFVLLFGATFLNYSQRFVFTQNTTNIQQTFTAEPQAGPPGGADAGTGGQRNVEAYSRAASRFALGFAVGALLFGILADAVSIRWLYPAVVLLWSLAGYLSGRAETIEGLAVSRFFVGLFEAGHWPCALRTTQRTFLPGTRTAANSVLQSGASIGAVLTPLLVLAIYLRDPAAWRGSFLIVSAVGIPWAAAWLLLVRESDVRRPAIQTDESSAGTGEQRQMVEIPFWEIFVTRRWWLLLVTVLCINNVWHFIRVWMTDWLENYHHYSHEFTSQFTSLYFLVTFFGSLASGALIAWLAGRGWNVHRARLATFLIFACLTGLVVPAAFLPKGWPLLGCLLVVAFGSLGLFPVYYSLNQELSARHQGKVGGSLAFATWLMLFFFHGWIGRLIEGDPESRTLVFCVVGLLPLVAYFVLRFGWGSRPGGERAVAS